MKLRALFIGFLLIWFPVKHFADDGVVSERPSSPVGQTIAAIILIPVSITLLALMNQDSRGDNGETGDNDAGRPVNAFWLPMSIGLLSTGVFFGTVATIRGVQCVEWDKKQQENIRKLHNSIMQNPREINTASNTFSVFNPEVKYCISNPQYLRNALEIADSTGNSFRLFTQTVTQKLHEHHLPWTHVDDSIIRKVTLAFNSEAGRRGGVVEELPYTVWEYCIQKNIKTFAVFYLYKIIPGIPVSTDTVRYSFPVPIGISFGSFMNMAMITISEDILENVTGCFAVYDVTSKKILRCVCLPEDSDYANFGELAELLIFNAIKVVTQ